MTALAADRTLALDSLRAAVAPVADGAPAGEVLTDAATLAARATDASATAPLGTPLAVVRPRTTAQVAAAVRVAFERALPVVPQGALSGLAGGATAVADAVLLDLTAMDRILAVDPVNQEVVVEPGVIVADLQDAVAAAGLFYPPDPASAALATIGGTIATNAGGMRCVKYGVTRDYVRSLQVVLADGSVVDTRPATVKAVAGYDLTGLVVGSEGTLGIVTRATLRLLPAPGAERGVSAAFPSLAAALSAADAVVAGSHRPSTLEVLDGVVLEAVARHAPDAGLPDGAQAWLLAVTDEAGDATATLEAFAGIMQAAGALRVDVAGDPDELEGLLAARRAFQPAMRAVKGESLNEDVSVPRTRLRELIGRIAEVSARHGVLIGTGGHVGDGNLHPVIDFDPDDAAQVAAARAAHADIMALASELGGTLTGEHGVGLQKHAAARDELPEPLRAMQHGVKQVFDPRGILNPGKKV